MTISQETDRKSWRVREPNFKSTGFPVNFYTRISHTQMGHPQHATHCAQQAWRWAESGPCPEDGNPGRPHFILQGQPPGSLHPRHPACLSVPQRPCNLSCTRCALSYPSSWRGHGHSFLSRRPHPNTIPLPSEH